MKKIILGVSVFAVLAIISVFAHTNSDDSVKTISVTGTGLLSIKPDSVTLNTGVNSSDQDVSKAIEKNNVIMNNVLSKLKELGIKDEYIQTSNYSVYFYEPYNQRESNEISEYRVSNSVVITIEEIDILSTVINNLVNIGITQINGISFKVKDIDQYSDKLTTLALNNSREKANYLAEAENMKVVSILSISENASSNYDPFMKRAPVLSYAESDVAISNGSEDISKSYNVVYVIEPK